jgi:hypothetical protein
MPNERSHLGTPLKSKKVRICASAPSIFALFVLTGALT